MIAICGKQGNRIKNGRKENKVTKYHYQLSNKSKVYGIDNRWLRLTARYGTHYRRQTYLIKSSI